MIRELEFYKNLMMEELVIKVNSEILLKLERYDKVASGFEVFLDSEELSITLDNKIDVGTLK